MKTSIPVNFYFICMVTAACLIIILPAPVFHVLFYETLIFSYLYVFLGRNACRVELTETDLQVKYLFFWERDKTVKIDSISEVECEKGFYDLFSSKTRGGLFVFPKYCADRLILKIKDDSLKEVVLININTRAFQFDKLYESLKIKVEAQY